MVEKRFTRALAYYDDSAVAQKMIVGKMMSLIDTDAYYDVILEVGCGSGNLSREVSRLKHGHLFLNDICHAVTDVASAKISGNAEFIIGDAESVDFANITGGADLVVSSSAVQWFSDMERFYSKMYSLLNPGGHFVFTTFVPGNMGEIAELSGCGLAYCSVEDHVGMLEKSGFTVESSFSEDIVLEFADACEVLKHIRHTGVNAIRKESWTRGRLEAFSMMYRTRFPKGNGVSLTYRPAYFRASKRDVSEEIATTGRNNS